MTKTLVQITDEIQRVLFQLDEQEQLGEEPSQELIEAVNDLLTKQAEKIDNCASYIGHAKSQIEWLKQEKNRIDFAIKKYEYTVEKLKFIAGRVMEQENADKLEGLRGHYFSKRKSSSVSIVDENEVPGQYAVIERKFDKTQLGKDLRAGKEIPGVKLVTKTNISVK